MLLDYAVIDDGTPDPSAPKSFPVAAVVVPVVVVILVALAGMFWFFRHRRGARRGPSSRHILAVFGRQLTCYLNSQTL